MLMQLPKHTHKSEMLAGIQNQVKLGLNVLLIAKLLFSLV